MMFFRCRKPSEQMFGQPPRLSGQGEARPIRMHCAHVILVAALILVAAFPASAATWTVHAQPTQLLNGAPVLFQVKPPAKLESLSGTWLGHQLTFSYSTTTKTWFTLAGVPFETKPGKYTIELKGERVAAKTPLNFTRTFVVARAPTLRSK